MWGIWEAHNEERAAPSPNAHGHTQTYTTKEEETGADFHVHTLPLQPSDGGAGPVYRPQREQADTIQTEKRAIEAPHKQCSSSEMGKLRSLYADADTDGS